MSVNVIYTALSVNIIALDVFVHTACAIRPAGSNEDESCSLSSAEIIYSIYNVLRCENYPQRTIVNRGDGLETH